MQDDGDEATALSAERDAETFYFCSEHCRQKFLAAPAATKPEEAAPGKAIYTCPMPPEIEQDHPGDCPKCGMALEAKTAMAHLIPALARQSWADSHTSRWLQFALTVPVVIWAGWPFFRRGWRSVVSRHLTMFTLIAIGVGAAFAFSAVATLMPDVFPHTMQHVNPEGGVCHSH